MKTVFIKKTIVAALTGSALLAVLPMTASAAKTNDSSVVSSSSTTETAKSAKMDKGEWIRKNDNWYFKIKGDYVKGWWVSDGYWYYFDKQGVMVHNTTITIEGKNYTFDSEGIYRQ